MQTDTLVRYIRNVPIEKGDDAFDPDKPIRFVASTEATDRYNDVIRADGWDLTNFSKNPVVLFAHEQTAPVGTAKAWVQGNALMSDIKLAERGTAPVVDYVRELVRQRILRTVSVGFLPKADPKPIKRDGVIVGFEYTSQELVEISLVAVPANPEALAIAKSVNLPKEFLGAAATMSHQRARADLLKLMPRLATIHSTKGR